MLNKISQEHMQRVITLSENNFKSGRIPIAAIIVDKDTNEVLAEAQNNDSPIGGKFSFDTDNRKKYPKNENPPDIIHPKSDKYWSEAVRLMAKHDATVLANN